MSHKGSQRWQHNDENKVCGLHKFVAMDIVAAALVGIAVVGARQVAGAGVVIDMTTAAVVTEVITTGIVYGVPAATVVVGVAFGTASTVAAVVVIGGIIVKEEQRVCQNQTV